MTIKETIGKAIALVEDRRDYDIILDYLRERKLDCAYEVSIEILEELAA